MPIPIPVKMGTDGSRFIVVKEECIDCEGTGLIHDPQQPAGTAFICTECQGVGGKLRKITLSCEKVITRKDVQIVRLNSFGGQITYAEFLEGKRPNS